MAKSSRKSNRKSSAKFRTALMQLKRLKPHHQCEAMKMANSGFIRQMCSHVKKLRYARVNAKQAKALKRYGTKLRTLANSRVSVSKKRHVLSQRGGFLPLIAPLLMSMIGPVVKSAARMFRR